MKKRILRYLKHVFGTTLLFLVLGASALVYMNGSFNYNQNDLRYDLENEGPYVFYENDSILNIQYIKGNREDGFYSENRKLSTEEAITLTTYFPLESSSFSFDLVSEFPSPRSIYNDNNQILAISDIESGLKTFRDFLIANKVIDKEFNWTFGKGHLVLVGDFVDRGFSTTQVLWFIFKLEYLAKQKGGTVHFIIGNHELYNMQGQFKSAEQKYYAVAAILGRQQDELYSKKSVLGNWISSKNTIEKINGVLFAHGGIHPELAEADISLDRINEINRQNYYHPYFPKPLINTEQLVLSNKKGICWYRGYFKDDLSQEAVEKGIDKFNAKSIVVGHTLQSKVKKLYNGKVYAIDVKHPADYIDMWPNRKSEGLLIDNDKFYRVLSTGEMKEL